MMRRPTIINKPKLQKMEKKTIGGDRLGSGKKMKVELHNYERSSHDKSHIFRTTMSAGTLVPFLKQIALPGDVWDIDLGCDVRTHPTVGPLFGSFKVQLDIFQCPIRLYQGKLHNNAINIGMNMAAIKLPIIRMKAPYVDDTLTLDDVDNSQINPSCILSYLGIRGVGTNIITVPSNAERSFNALGLLSYWDTVKNYYANKQEEIGAVIHSEPVIPNEDVASIEMDSNPLVQAPSTGPINMYIWGLPIKVTNTGTYVDPSTINIRIGNTYETSTVIALSEIVTNEIIVGADQNYYFDTTNYGQVKVWNWDYNQGTNPITKEINVVTFPLENIDTMRNRIMAHAVNATPFNVTTQGLSPYSLVFMDSEPFYSRMESQEGLALKTYQSDLLNNWLSTEWIDGPGGISEITAIDTSGGNFTIDTLNLANKVYNMLNRIAVSGGTYDDWLDVNWMHDRIQRAETPIYHGGLIKELVFQEVISNAEANGNDNGGSSQPLGTLAGKGVMGDKHKGGQVTIKVDEPSYILGIVSLTPRIDYSQGNDWDVNLQTIDDLHKPALDGIGYQELITEQAAWWATNWDGTKWVTTSAGKQPAWINYMTEINKVKGNFAIKNNEMFMTLNRRYEVENNVTNYAIADMTTYIDPRKFNQIFAQTSLDSQNFWVQIAMDITMRGKISAKQIPNL